MIHKTKNYVRYRILSPKLFIKNSFRTLDIGKPKRHMLIRGRLKSNGEWRTQAVIVEKGISSNITKKIVRRARGYG